MRPSSTSSSERRAAPWPRGLLLALGMLALIEIFVGRSEWVWSAFPRSAGGVLDAMETTVVEPVKEAHVLLMGSSRIRDALLPRDLERQLALPRQSVLNLGMTSGTPRDAVVLYERNRAKLGQAELVVLGIEDWHFNRGMRPNDRDFRLDTWDDRWRGFSGSARASLLVGYVWRTYGARGALHHWFESTRDAQRAPLSLGPDGRLDWRSEEPQTGPEEIDVQAQIDVSYERYSFRDQTFDVIRELATLVAEDHGRLVLVQVPLRDEYLDAAEAQFPAELDRYRRARRTLSAEYPALFWERSSDAQIPPTAFIDYGHLTRTGAAAFTEQLGARLRALDVH